MDETYINQNNIEVSIIDFNEGYGRRIGNVICKDCKNGKKIVANVFVDVTGHAEISIFCKEHGEREPDDFGLWYSPIEFLCNERTNLL